MTSVVVGIAAFIIGVCVSDVLQAKVKEAAQLAANFLHAELAKARAELAKFRSAFKGMGQGE